MLRIAHVDAREPVYAGGEMLLGIGPILRPPAGRSAPPRYGSESTAAIVGILDAQKMEFGVSRENRVGSVGSAAKASKSAAAASAETLGKGYGCQRHYARG